MNNRLSVCERHLYFKNTNHSSKWFTSNAAANKLGKPACPSAENQGCGVAPEFEWFRNHSTFLRALVWNSNAMGAMVAGLVWEWNHAILTGMKWEWNALVTPVSLLGLKGPGAVLAQSQMETKISTVQAESEKSRRRSIIITPYSTRFRV